MLVTVGKSSPEDAESSYDFLHKLDFFAPTSKISRAMLQNLIKAEGDRGLVDQKLSVDRLVMPDVTDLVD